MAIEFSGYLSQDIRDRHTNLSPIIVIGNFRVVDLTPLQMDNDNHFSGDEAIVVGAEGNRGTLMWSGDALNVLPLLLNIHSLKESIDLESRRYKINDINVEVSNAPLNGQRFSDAVSDRSLLNVQCRIYWVGPRSSRGSLWGSDPIYEGFIRRYTHDGEKARLVIENNTQAKLHKDLPLHNLGAKTNVPSRYKNAYIPMVFGRVDKSPLVSDNGYVSFKADTNQTIVYREESNEYGVPESALFFGSSETGFANVDKAEQLEYIDNEVVLKKAHPEGDSEQFPDSDYLADSDEYFLKVSDRSSNYKLAINNPTHLPTADTSEFCNNTDQLANVKWFSGSPEDQEPNIVTLATQFDATYYVDPNAGYCGGFLNKTTEWLMMSLRIDFTPLIEFKNLKMRSFVLNSRNLTGVLANEYGANPALETWGGFPIGGTYDGSPSSGHLKTSHTGDRIGDCNGLGINYDEFNHVKFDHLGRSVHQAELNDIFNFSSCWYPNNPSANLRIDSWIEGYKDDGSINPNTLLAQEFVLFFSGGASTGIFAMDFRILGMSPSCDDSEIEDCVQMTTYDSVRVGMNVQGRLDNIGILRIYDAYKIFQYDFFANVSGRVYVGDKWAEGTIATSIQQIFAMLLVDDLGMERQIIIPTEYDHWKYDFTIHEKINSKQLFEELASASPFIPRFTHTGDFILEAIPSAGGVRNDDLEIKEEDVIDFSFSRTPIEDVYTKIEFQYRWDYGMEEFTKSIEPISASSLLGADYSPSYYGLGTGEEENKLVIDDHRGKYIRDTETALNFARWKLLWHTNQHLKIKVKLPLAYMNREIGDIIGFDKLIGDIEPYGINYVENNYLNGQLFYKNFMVVATNKNLKWCEIELMQMHSLMPCINEWGVPDEFDCNGVCGGGAVLDPCGVCGGENTIEDCPCPNGECDHPECTMHMDCNNECGGTATTNSCGECDEPERVGCMDSMAANYDANACVNDLSLCLYPLFLYDAITHRCCADPDDLGPTCYDMLAGIYGYYPDSFFYGDPDGLGYGLLIDLNVDHGLNVDTAIVAAQDAFNAAGGEDGWLNGLPMSQYYQNLDNSSSRPVIYRSDPSLCEGAEWITEGVSHFVDYRIFGFWYRNNFPWGGVNEFGWQPYHIEIPKGMRNMVSADGTSSAETGVVIEYNFTACTEPCYNMTQCCGDVIHPYNYYTMDGFHLKIELSTAGVATGSEWGTFYTNSSYVVPADSHTNIIITDDLNAYLLAQIPDEVWDVNGLHNFFIKTQLWDTSGGGERGVYDTGLQMRMWQIHVVDCPALGDISGEGEYCMGQFGCENDSAYLWANIYDPEGALAGATYGCAGDFNCNGQLDEEDYFYELECLQGVWQGSWSTCQEMAELWSTGGWYEDAEYYADLFACWLT